MSRSFEEVDEGGNPNGPLLGLQNSTGKGVAAAPFVVASILPTPSTATI
jgi:hypothetical protein